MVSFDADEYLHLALHASRTGQPHACMTYLKHALEQWPDHAAALYLLAVQHAEIGLHERAIAGMQAALALQPGLETARFQLGLLLLDTHRSADARQHFALLAAGSIDHGLQAYSKAMLALVDQNPLEAQTQLRAGLSQPPSNAALSQLMQRLLDDLASQTSTVPPQPATTPAFLGAYQQAAL